MDTPPAKYAKNGCAALFLGTIGYLIFALEVIGDDPFIAFPVQIVMGFVATLFMTFLARILGLLLRVEPFSDIWYWSRLIPATVVVAGITGVIYHKQLPPSLCFISWFAVIFGTTHFWTRKPGQERGGEPPPPGNESL